MTTKYYVNNSGNYLGGFDGSIPPNSTEVPSAPQFASQHWNGTSWDILSPIPQDDCETVICKTNGHGIKVDIVTPSFPYKDLTGDFLQDIAGSDAPILTVFRGGNVRSLVYDLNARSDIKFHLPHDYAPNTDIFLHVHWSHHGTAISGNLVIDCGYTYAKGFMQDVFPVEKHITITQATTNIATTPRWSHNITEVPLSIAGGSSTLLNTSDIEPDGMILMGFIVTGLPTISGGTVTNNIFITQIDIHYQSTNIGTKNKDKSNGSFWS